MAHVIDDQSTVVNEGDSDDEAVFDDPGTVFRPDWNKHLRPEYQVLSKKQKERFEMYGLFHDVWIVKAMSAGHNLFLRAKQLTRYTFDGNHKHGYYRMSDLRNLKEWYLEAVAVYKTAMMAAFEPRLKQKHVGFHGESFLSVGNPLHSNMTYNQDEAAKVIGATMRNFNGTVVLWADSQVYGELPSRYDDGTAAHHFYTAAKEADEAYKNVSINMDFLYNQFLRETGKLRA